MTTGSPWDEDSDLSDTDFRSLYGAEAEAARFLAFVHALERCYAEQANRILASLKTLSPQ